MKLVEMAIDSAIVQANALLKAVANDDQFEGSLLPKAEAEVSEPQLTES
jgi:hypothetical protein